MLEVCRRGIGEGSFDEIPLNYEWMETTLIRWKRAGEERHRARTLLIRCGVVMIAVGGIYLAGGLAGIFPLEKESLAWNNIRIISGVAILGCLLAAVGYGNE